MSDYRCLLYDYPHLTVALVPVLYDNCNQCHSSMDPVPQCCMAIVNWRTACVMCMCASLLYWLVTPQYAWLPAAVCCQLMPLNVAVLLYLPTSAHPPPYYASGRSLLLYCFRHWVHHPCPRTSAPCVSIAHWATKRKQAKRYPPLQGYRKFLRVHWSETSMCADVSFSWIVETKSVQKNFDLRMFWNIGDAYFPIDWCKLWCIIYTSFNRHLAIKCIQ